MEPITIKKNGQGGFTVIQGDRYSDGVAFEEMLGIVIALTMDAKHFARFNEWMLTEEEWRKYHPWLFRDQEED